ncbi:unnamed protein product [Amaranthus hypochondriacus]
MSRERGGRARNSAKRLKKFELEAGRRNVAPGFLPKVADKDRWNVQRHHNSSRPVSDQHGGHRGYSSPPWGYGPREPRFSKMGLHGGKYVTIFMDGVSSSATKKDIKDLCEDCGQVVDIYISRKARKNTKWAFGFVRFSNGDGALKAISNLDGKIFMGLKLKVSKARYNKDGRPFQRNHDGGTKSLKTWRPIIATALRDGRKYSEVVIGKKVQQQSQAMVLKEAMEVQNNGEEHMEKVKLQISENPVMINRLSMAAVVDLKKPTDIKIIETILNDNDMEAVGISSLSSYKVVIFFDNECSVQRAIAENSPLKNAFSDIRRWSDDEYDGERFVWLECVGLHPKCWGQENFRAIGNLWGTTVKFVHVANGLHSLTTAKVLVRTKRLEKIEGRVTLEWEAGSCVIWVQEVNYEEISGEVYEEDSNEDEDNNASKQVQHTVLEGSNVQLTPAYCEENGLVNKVIMVNENGTCFLMQEAESDGRRQCDEPAGEENANEEGKSMHGCEVMGTLNMDESWAQMTRDKDVILNTQTQTGRDANKGQQVVHDIQSQLVETFDASIMEICRRDGHREPVDWFDPISSIELNSSQIQNKLTLGSNISNTQKRQRGRPKRIMNSLPEPLYVQSTPSPRELEAVETWNSGKTVGVRSKKEKEVISRLRKSKRLLLLEDDNPTG